MRRRRAQAEARAEADAALRDELARLERRVSDVEDTVAAVLQRSRLDDLAEQLDELAMTSTTHDDLLRVRMHAARLAAEVARSVVELRVELRDHVHGRDAATG